MGRRDFLFLGLVAGGLIALGTNLVPPREPAVPAHDTAAYHAADFTAAVAKLDAAFAADWEEAGLTPAAPADGLTVARRLSLGLTGTVPSLEEIRALETVPEADRADWWAEHLLKDPRFHDYFAERLARAIVGTEDGPFILYRRRKFVGWIADRVAENKPYDAVARELIAGRGLWTDHPATNFISVTANPEMDNKPDPVRLAGRVSRGVLGLRLDCAQCHDHPFAAWKQTDFEGLAAFFGQTRIGFKGVADGDGDYEIEDAKTLQKRVVPMRVPARQDLMPADGTRRERLAAWATHKQNPFFARATVNRVWAVVFGRPLTDPVDNLDPSDPGHPAIQILADDFAAHDFDLHRLLRVVIASRAFRMESKADGATDAHEAAWAVFPLTRLRPEQVAGSLLQSASVSTVGAESHILARIMKYTQMNDFVKHYGDTGDDEFDKSGGTVTQRLALMNGNLVSERIKNGPFNASSRIGWMADDPRAVETAYLACLTRRPTPSEAEFFRGLLAEKEFPRSQRMEDLYWTLINSTEFAWNH